MKTLTLYITSESERYGRDPVATEVVVHLDRGKVVDIVADGNSINRLGSEYDYVVEALKPLLAVIDYAFPPNYE